jgi:hypothetical protein
MKVVFSSWNTLTNETFGIYSIGQYMKVVISSWNALTNEALSVHSIRPR